jgi:hypothetical protein
MPPLQSLPDALQEGFGETMLPEIKNSPQSPLRYILFFIFILILFLFPGVFLAPFTATSTEIKISLQFNNFSGTFHYDLHPHLLQLASLPHLKLSNGTCD